MADGGTDLATLIDTLRPGAVINAAYVQGGPDLDAVTALAPGRMAEACRRVGARFVHLSTDVVFDGTTVRPYRESDPPSPVHDYGRAKAEAEESVAAADPGAVIVRTSLLWGDRADPGPQVEMAADPDMIFFDDEYRNPLQVSVLAEACLELAHRDDVSGVLHVAGADTVSRLEFARRVSPLVDTDPGMVRGAPTPTGSTRPRNCPLDSARARSLLSTTIPGILEATA
jgi:dTDP-4-dehydrorhamnose reductase